MIEFDTSGLQALEDALQGIAIDADELLDDVGTLLVDRTQDRMATGHDAEGNAWSPWSPRYASERRGPGGTLLYASGALRESIEHRPEGGDTVVVESPLSYAFITQETRPFLGVSGSEDEILAIAEHAIEESFRAAA